MPIESDACNRGLLESQVRAKAIATLCMLLMSSYTLLLELRNAIRPVTAELLHCSLTAALYIYQRRGSQTYQHSKDRITNKALHGEHQWADVPPGS